MSKPIETNSYEMGKTEIANEVIAIIAGLAASEVKGVASMSSGIVEDITSSLGMKNARRGIKVETEGKTATITISIIVEYGFKITEVADNIRSRVIEAVETMTGMSVKEVNIFVQGIDIKKEQKKES